MLVDHKNFEMHARWIALVVAATAAAGGWYLIAGLRGPRWPGGSSLPGLVFGIAAALIIVFELALWPRKRRRAWRIGRAQTWLRAHIWLGLLSVPLVALHSGGELGGQLSTVLMLIFAVVIGSGLWGLMLQQVLPKLMLDRLPSETIYSEIEHIAEQSCYDAEDLVLTVCGPGKDGEFARLRPPQEEIEGRYLAVGAYRAVGKTSGKVLQTRVQTVAVANSEPLRVEFYTSIAPYLLAGRKRTNYLHNPQKSVQFFDKLKSRLDPAAHSVVDELDQLCSQRRQFDLQARVHHWLHGWLLVHAPLSVLLFVLLLVHIYVACMYW